MDLSIGSGQDDQRNVKFDGLVEIRRRYSREENGVENEQVDLVGMNAHTTFLCSRFIHTRHDQKTHLGTASSTRAAKEPGYKKLSPPTQRLACFDIA